jgi:hypothetical protein
MKISGIILAGIALGLFLIPAFASQDIYFLTSGSGSGNVTDTTVCLNVGSGALIVKESTNGDCEIKSIVGSADISVTNDTNTIIIDFNGTVSGESTQCINVGAGTVIIKNSTSGNCFVKTFVSGNGISFSNGTDTVTITNTGIISNQCDKGINCSGTNPSIFNTDFVNGTGISITGSVSQTFTNTLPESTVCTNLGLSSSLSEGIYVSGNCNFKKLLEGSNIALSSNGTHVTIAVTGINSDDTVCTNLGTSTSLNEGIYSTGECNFKRLGEDTGITLSSNSTTVLVKNTYTCTSAGGTSIIKTNTAGSNCDLKGLTAERGITVTSNTNDLGIGVAVSSLAVVVFQSETRTNVGTAYVDAYQTAFAMEDMNFADFHGYDNVDVEFMVDYIGTGTQQIRIVASNDNSLVLFESSGFSADCDLPTPCGGTVPIPASFLDTAKRVEMQIKSNVAGDDPIVKGYTITLS